MEPHEVEDKKPIRIPIQVNKLHVEWDRETITGLEILDIANEKPADYDVYIVRKGEQDQPVGTDEKVTLTVENRHFRTVPKHVTEG